VARDTLLLIDGHALVYRAFFAMPALSNSRGEMTNAVFGYTSMLLKVFGEHSPTYAIACFDPPGPTFRHTEFADYKAQRPSMPDELRRQLPICREITEALNIPMIELPGFEADDVIGTLARRAEESGLDVLILTGDLDALQLVTEHVSVYATRRGITETVVYDVPKVWERYGFPPAQVVDFKALQGDVSDNIPGVPGIGEKTAKALIQEYGPLESILAAVPSMKEGKVKRLLSEHADQAVLSKRMATIVVDVDVPFEIEKARLSDYDVERVKALFDHLEFRSLMSRLPKYRKPESASAAADGAAGQIMLQLQDAAAGVDVTVVRSAAQVDDAVRRLRAASGVAVRTVVEEPARRGRIVGLALASLDDAMSAWYVPVEHEDDGGSVGGDVLAPFTTLLGDAAVLKTVYDLKRDLLAWRARDVPVAGVDTDLLLCAYLVNTRARVPGLPLLAEELCGVRMDTEEALLGSGRNARRIAQLGVDEAAAYFGRWVAMLGPLRAALRRQLDEFSMRTLHDDMELPLVPILAEMEVCGIAVDTAQLQVLSRELHDRIVAIESEVHDIAGHTFNIGSTQQLATVLYDDLGLAMGRRTKTGRSTDADTLESLRGEHPVVDLVLEWRQLTKLKGTYVDALPLLVEGDGRVHTSFNQTVATTGRLSSSDPNLQNVPVRTDWGQRIRRTFVADDREHVLISADYSQIELRVLAHVTNDTDLVEAFRRGEDIHTRTAAEVCGVEPAAVTPEMRRNAKVVNFGVLYGLSDFGLARDTGMSKEDARGFITTYFEKFAAVANYLEQIRNFAREWGYVETLFGRRRYIPDIRAANQGIRRAAERMAVNMPIQGTAADIMKLAMIRTDRQLHDAGLRTRLMLQVHDELVLEAPRAEVDELAPLLRTAMGEAATLTVPLDVDVKVGENWGDMKLLATVAGMAR
jgi:DNA polymerase-1